MSGSAIADEPRCVIISGKCNVALLTIISNGGTLNSGKPVATGPVKLNGWISYRFKMYANSVPNITTKALRPSERYFNVSFCHGLMTASLEFLLYLSLCKNDSYQTTFKWLIVNFYLLPLVKVMRLWCTFPKEDPKCSFRLYA